MTNKVLAFIAMIALFGGLFHFRGSPQTEAMAPQVTTDPLLPSTVGEYQLADRWRNEQRNQRIEVGGNYQTATTHERVQLDFFTEGPGTHNGISCYLVKGWSLTRQWLLQVGTFDSSAIFDMAFMVDGQYLRLVAATECYSNYCREHALPNGPYWFSPKIDLLGFAVRRADMVVPVSITLEAECDLRSRAVSSTVEAALVTSFNKFAKYLDLGPMRRLSAQP